MAVPKLNLTSQQQQWIAQNTRVQDGKLYQRAADGTWKEVPPGQSVRIPGSQQSFGAPGGGQGGNTGFNIPLLGGGGDRGGAPGGGSTGPGGATFRPPPQPPPTNSLPVTPPGTLPPLGPGVSLGTPPPDPNAPDNRSTSTTSPGTPTTPPAVDDGSGILNAILEALKKYGTNPKVLGALGKMLSDWRTGRQDGRILEQLAATTNNQTNTTRYLAELGGGNLDLNQRIYLGTNYDRNARNAIYGDYMQGVQDLNIPRPEGVPTRNITGGLRPSAFPNRAAIGGAMEKEAMTELLDPTRVASDPRSGTKRLPAIPTLPEKIDVPEPGAFDKALEALGLGASVLPLIKALVDARQPKPTWKDLPIVPPDPLRPNIPQIPLGDAPIDPYSTVDPYGTQGLLDTLKKRRTTAPGGYFPDPDYFGRTRL